MSPPRLVIKESETLELLMDRRRGLLLSPFLARACTVTQAARENGVARNVMAY